MDLNEICKSVECTTKTEKRSRGGDTSRLSLSVETVAPNSSSEERTSVTAATAGV